MEFTTLAQTHNADFFTLHLLPLLMSKPLADIWKETSILVNCLLTYPKAQIKPVQFLNTGLLYLLNQTSSLLHKL